MKTRTKIERNEWKNGTRLINVEIGLVGREPALHLRGVVYADRDRFVASISYGVFEGSFGKPLYASEALESIEAARAMLEHVLPAYVARAERAALALFGDE